MMLRTTQRNSITGFWLPIVCAFVLITLALVGSFWHVRAISPQLNSCNFVLPARSVVPVLEANSIRRPIFASMKAGIPVRTGPPQEFTVASPNHLLHHTFLKYKLRHAITAIDALSPHYVYGSTVKIIVLFAPFLRLSQPYTSYIGRAPPTL